MTDAVTPPLERHKQAQSRGDFVAGKQPQAQPFTMVLPPPNVTGSLHIGHALNTTLQDILARFYRLVGRDVLWLPGTDHAGIAAQSVVERALTAEKTTRQQLGREAFLQRMWQQKETSANTIAGQWARLGLSLDFSRERFTLDAGLCDAVNEIFVRLYKDGLIYRDKRLVNYDVALQTVISDLEVQQKPVNGTLWHIFYPFADGDGTDGITVATTRPETMFGDMAVIVHPDDARYTHAIGRQVRIPQTDRTIVVLADAAADPETGTGAVKITPAHDFNDFDTGKRHNLPLLNILNADGTLNDAVPSAYRGLERFAARKALLAALEETGALVAAVPHQHTVPHGDRSGTVAEPFLTDQWYVNAEALAQPAIAAVEAGRTQFVPALYTDTFFRWMRNIKPWCISRQLWWGHRIPAWYDAAGNIYVANTAEQAQQQAGQGVALTQDPDVLDTWFSSGLWPFSTLGWPQKTADLARYYPTDVLVTGFDIIFFWVARMMMMGLYVTGEVPFKTVCVHALVRDEHGQKMSKSKGNVVDPLAIVEEYGADALRFTLASLAVPARDIKLSAKRIEVERNFITKIRNAARYAQINNAQLSPAVSLDSLQHPVNSNIVALAAEATRDIATALQTLRFDEAARVLTRFVRNEFCDRYIEYTKPLLQQPDEATQRETRHVLAAMIERVALLASAFMPYVAEDICPNVAQLAWPSNESYAHYAAHVQQMATVSALIDTIRSVRAEMRVPASAMLPLLMLGTAHADAQTHVVLLQRLARVTTLETLSQAPEGAVRFAVGTQVFALPLQGVIDADAERARLEAEIATLQAYVDTAQARLANAGFMAKASEDVIDDTRAQIDTNVQRIARLREVLG